MTAPTVLRRRATAVVAALALAASTGCTVPTDEVARPIEDAPVDLLDVSTTTVELVPEEEVEFVLNLYFYDDLDQLVAVKRPFPEQTPFLVDVLASLGAVTPEEQEDIPGISTRLLADGALRLADADTEDTGIATVIDDTNLYRALEADRLQRIYSQIVCTLTGARTELLAVQIVDADGVIPVQSQADASVIEGPVGPEQLNNCRTVADIEAEAIAAAEAEAGEDEGAEEDDG
ncbi:MAG: hypothetical protein AAGA59_20370 [Actinomycetota bacterium]